ncbi:uncharacterized protein Z518_01986 [Rhinocladiella mackenziei CBS 650.93]|uniref:Uncharacterized protein n=1 Tax=Rhinocladiella mackenziei CBS 650.93 TaxID=1442369 RepID=A0A0D2HA24_9EURO|nr:uncharacterized protein Z518_01986 [Rhinocladiella mackenziei CBS 650.93]KIX07333.1 hypothetical protein Z518_01986 [Rhinocladiella mackenziei CBS 650.93]
MDLFGAPEICVEEQNSRDISKYVQTTLAQIFAHRDARKQLESAILHKAAGNFLWTALILPKVAHRGRSGYRLDTIREEVQNSSPELGQVYKDALAKIPASEKLSTLRLFRWVCLAEEPLSPAQMRDALCFDAEPPQQGNSFAAWTASENYVETEEQMEKQIRALSGGLVETTRQGLAIVQYIHQSVKDYFLQQGLQHLEQSVGLRGLRLGLEATLARCHELIFKCCMHYVLTDEIRQLSTQEMKSGPDEYPLLRYAVTRWPSHLKKADIDGTLQQSLLAYFQWPSNRILNQWLSLCSKKFRACGLGAGVDILHVASYYDLCHLVDAVARRKDYKMIDPKDLKGCTPLTWAAKNGHEAAAKCLIGHGADVNSLDAEQRSPLWWASNFKHSNMIHVLIGSGGNPDLQDATGGTALYWAATNYDHATVEVLLSGGANPSVQDHRGRTPLYSAVQTYFDWNISGIRRIVKKLLESGARPNKKLSEDQHLLEWAIHFDLRALAFLKALQYRNVPIALRFAESGINAQKFTEFSGKTPIDYVLAVQLPELAEALLRRKNCDPNGCDPRGMTPLIAIAREGRIDMMRSLLGLGAEVDLSDSDNRTPLSYVAGRGHLNAARFLIDTGANLDLKDKYGRTPLFWAVEGGHQALVDLLLENGADPRSEDSSGRTALFWAARGGSSDVMRSLLKKVVDVEHQDSKGQTPLWWAVTHRQLSTTGDLLAGGANPNAVSLDGQRLLLWTASAGYLPGAKLLLQYGADVDARNHRQQTALLLAADNGHAALVKLLLGYKADSKLQDSDGFTPLSAAVRRGFGDVVEALCELRRFNNGDPTGRTQLLSAVMTGNENIAKLLLSHGADADCRGYRGRTPLSFACEYGYDSLVEVLLGYHVDIDSRDENGRTPLWWAATCGRTMILGILLNKGANSSIACNSGDLPISKAVNNGNTTAVRLLLKHNPNHVSDPESSLALLGLATDSCDSAMVLVLIEEGADCNITLPSGYTLSSWAAKNGFLDLVKELAARGIDLWSTSDQDGLTAFDWAVKNGYGTVVQFLLETPMSTGPS